MTPYPSQILSDQQESKAGGQLVSPQHLQGLSELSLTMIKGLKSHADHHISRAKKNKLMPRYHHPNAEELQLKIQLF